MKVARPILRLGRGALLIVSALLAFAAAAGWVRSRFVGDQIMRITLLDTGDQIPIGDMDGFQHGKGSFAVFHVRFATQPASAVRPPTVTWSHDRPAPADFTVGPSHIVFGIGHYGYLRQPLNGNTPAPVAVGVLLPYWLPLILFAAGPLWWLLYARRRRRAARRISRGCCPACGYDLRASPDRCPECGHAREGVALATTT